MPCVTQENPRKFRKQQITVTVNPLMLDRLDKLGDAVGRNRSEMVDRAIEEYVRSHASELPPESTGKRASK